MKSYLICFIRSRNGLNIGEGNVFVEMDKLTSENIKGITDELLKDSSDFDKGTIIITNIITLDI